MDDKKIAEILDNGGDANKTVEPSTTDGESKVYEVNGRKYTAAEVDKMAADFQASERERGRLAQEVGSLKKPATPQPTADQGQGVIPMAERPTVQKVFKEELNFVTKEDLDMRDYTKAAYAETQRLADKYGVDVETIQKELVDLQVRPPIASFEKLFAASHFDKYEEKRRAEMAANKPATPYTERTVKSGLETGGGSAEPISFRKNNISKKAMELIGANE